MKFLFFLVLCTSLAAENDVLRQVRAHELIGEHVQAAEIAHAAILASPADAELYAIYVRALAEAGFDGEAIEALGAFQEQFPDAKDPLLVERVAWSTIRTGARASAASTQLAALVGGAMTRDASAVDLILAGMRSRNRILRKVALQLAPSLRDAPLKDEVVHLMRGERVWEVRLQAMQAAGKLGMRELLPELEKTIGSTKTSDEERLVAIGAVVEMLEEVDPVHLRLLARHKRAGLRQLACEVVAHLDLEEEVEVIEPLLNDPIPQVRAEALVTLGLLRVDGHEKRVRALMKDREPSVAITAAWLMTLIEPDEGMAALERHLKGRNRFLAAAALARTGQHGLPLARRVLAEHPDSVVRANVALGLIGERVEVERSADALYTLLQDQEKRWMWAPGHSLFRPLAKSRVRRGQGGGPEVVDQLTRLELLGALAVAGHPHALDALRTFLGERTWGISGVAAITLLEEGDEAAIELVRALLDDPEQQVRAQAAIALAVWGKDPTALESLEKLYPHADRRLKVIILEGLGHIGAHEAIPFLIAALSEPFPTLRIIAASSLIQCING